MWWTEKRQTYRYESIIFWFAVSFFSLQCWLEMEPRVLNMFDKHAITQVDPFPYPFCLLNILILFILCVCIIFAVNSLLFYVIKIFVSDWFGTWGVSAYLKSTDLAQWLSPHCRWRSQGTGKTCNLATWVRLSIPIIWCGLTSRPCFLPREDAGGLGLRSFIV